MHGQYHCLSEQLPVDMKETIECLKAVNLPGATAGLVVTANERSSSSDSVIMSTISCIKMLFPLATCAVQAWRQLTMLWQAVVLWHQWTTTLIDTTRLPLSPTGTCQHFQVPVESSWYWHQPDRLVEMDDIMLMCHTTIPNARRSKPTEQISVSQKHEG